MNPKECNLILIRHGEIEYPLNESGQRTTYGPDVLLSEVGIKQMNILAQEMKEQGMNLDVLVASPYLRTQQSALPFAREFGVPILSDYDLRDVDAPGWQGVTIEELASLGGDIYAIPRRSEDQEDLEQLVTRARNVLSGIVQGREGMNIGVVSHGDLLGAMNWVLTREGVPSSYKEMVTNKYLDKAQAIVYQVEGNLTTHGEGRLIVIEESQSTKEGYRGNKETK